MTGSHRFERGEVEQIPNRESYIPPPFGPRHGPITGEYGNSMPCRQEKGHKPSANDACGTADKNAHWYRPFLPSPVRFSRRIALRLNDRSIRLRYELIDQGRRGFATLKMRLYGSHWNLREHKGSALELRRTDPTECMPRKLRETGLELLRLIKDAAFERPGPGSLNEIMTTVEQQQLCIVQMQACPGRCVKRGGKSVAGLDGRDKSRLIRSHGRQPQLSEQQVAGREAVIE
jgi:hypothetical protein